MNPDESVHERLQQLAQAEVAPRPSLDELRGRKLARPAKRAVLVAAASAVLVAALVVAYGRTRGGETRLDTFATESTSASTPSSTKELPGTTEGTLPERQQDAGTTEPSSEESTTSSAAVSTTTATATSTTPARPAPSSSSVSTYLPTTTSPPPTSGPTTTLALQFNGTLPTIGLTNWPAALPSGTLEVHSNCLYLNRTEGLRLIVWPSGSTVTEDRTGVRLPNGTVIGPIGAQVNFTGGEVPPSYLSDHGAVGVEPACITNPVLIAAPF